MILLAACMPGGERTLPTLQATAVPISGLQSAGNTAAGSVPTTYTPFGWAGDSGQEAWGTLQPTVAGQNGDGVTLPTNTLPAIGETVEIPPTNTAVSTPTTAITPPSTPLPGSTNTAVPPTATPVPPSPTPTPTATPIPLPTATFPPPTATSIPPSPTSTHTPTTVPGPPGVSPVYRNAVFPIQVTIGVVYGQGMRHDGWNEPGGEVMNLTLDIYSPANSPGLRPSILLYHGGGFQGGSSSYPNMVQTAEYYAARGWVVFVVNYRLEQDYGSVPVDWPAEPGYIVYPAGRDAKAAVRWVHANAGQYSVSTDHVTVFGGSAGGMLALMLGMSDPSDYRDELTVGDDPTLPSTNMNASAEVHTVVMLWGNQSLVVGLETYDGRNRYDPGGTPTIIIHGSEDTTIPLPVAEEIYLILISTGIPAEFHIMTGAGHSAWGDPLDDGRSIFEGAFDFIVLQQGLNVID